MKFNCVMIFIFFFEANVNTCLWFKRFLLSKLLTIKLVLMMQHISCVDLFDVFSGFQGFG